MDSRQVLFDMTTSFAHDTMEEVELEPIKQIHPNNPGVYRHIIMDGRKFLIRVEEDVVYAALNKK